MKNNSLFGSAAQSAISCLTQQQLDRPKRRSPAACERLVCRRIKHGPAALFIFGHHKCATVWSLAYLTRLGEANGWRVGSTHLSQIMVPGDLVLFGNASYRYAISEGLSGAHIVRNPFSLVSSAYFSHRNTHSIDGWPQLPAQRARLRSIDTPAGMRATLDFLESPAFHAAAIAPLQALNEWDYDDPAFLHLRMEDMVRQPSAAFGRALAFAGRGAAVLPDDSAVTFKSFAGGRNPGEVDEASHFRSGDRDDWRRHMPIDVAARVRERYSNLLRRFYPDLL